MAILFAFIVWLRGPEGGALQALAAITAALYAVGGVYGVIALVHALSGRNVESSRRSQAGLVWLVAAIGAMSTGFLF